MSIHFTLYTVKRTVVLPNATNRMFNAMTHNPIYDGPVYDSIVQSQFDTLPTNLKASDASAAGQIMLPLSGPSCSDQVSDNSGSVSPKRYIKQSRQAKLLLPNTSCEKSSAPTADIVNASESTASSQSVTDSVAANNQAKPFDIPPSYSECTSNDGSLRINETPKSKAVKQTVSAELRSNDDEDSKYMYTVMEPIGAIPFSLEKQELN